MSDFDPTTNRIQFGMLTPDERTALVNWQHGWEYYTIFDECWNATDNPAWGMDVAYCGRPKPVVISRWFNVYLSGPTSHGHSSRKSADAAVGFGRRIAVLRIDTCNGVSTAHLEDA